MPRPPLRKLTPAEQMRWIRNRIDGLYREACNKEVLGWCFVSVLRGWREDYEQELNRMGRLRPSDKDLLR